MNKYIHIFKSKLFKNGLWLYLLQFFQTVIPIFTLPYITRVLGIEKYGAFSIALNIILYFEVIVEYGFNMTGSRKIAIARKDEITDIYSRIMTAKILLCILSFIGLNIYIYISNYTMQQQKSMLILFVLVIGIAIQQTWFFQGLQKMKFITIATVIARLISVICIFIFVKSESDVYLYCFLYSSTHIISGIISTFIIRVHFNIHYKFTNLHDSFYEIKDGFSIFLTSAMSKLITGLGVTILGIVSTQSEVGIYSAIQKLPYIMILFFRPIGQILFPYISKQFIISYDKGIYVAKKALIMITISFGFICMVIMLNAKLIIKLLYGDEYLLNINIIYPLIIWVLLSIINNILGIQILVASGHKTEYTRAFTISSFFVLSLNIILGIKYSIYGVAYAALISEAILTLGILFHIKKISMSQRDVIRNN